MSIPSKLPSIYFALLLLIFPLTNGQNYENEKQTELQERLLSKLMQAERERNMKPAVRKADGPEVTVQDQGSGRRRIDIFKDGFEIERILQDCQNKYELIIMNKDDEDALGRCYVHKMEDRQYEADCNGSGEKLERKYDVGLEIEDKTILSQIEGAEACLERLTFELIVVSMEAQTTEENDKKSNAFMRSKCSNSCVQTSVCTKYCEQYGWWTTRDKCKKEGMKCYPHSSCTTVCG